MATDDHTRRRFLYLTGTATAVSLAGCSESDSGDDSAETTTEPEPETTTQSTGSDADAVPAEYETATSLSGQQRNPDALSPKDAVKYQSEPKDGEQCSGCNFYVEDKNGDDVGACAVVEGQIEPKGWCSTYVAYEE